jgi:hypothetical protein
MAVNEIKCPNCGHEFELSGQLVSTLENELKKKFSAKEEELEDRLLTEKKQFIKDIEGKTTERLQSDFDLKSSFLQEQLENTNIKYLESQEKIQKLLLETSYSQQGIEEERVRLLEEYNKDKKELETQIQTKVDEEHRLKTLERDKIIEDQKNQLINMERRLSQGSQQLAGEVLEIDIESKLQATYPLDKVLEVKKGVQGADITQVVYNNYQQECGKILIELKNTKEFAKKWVSKLRDDKLESKADVAMLLTSVLPTGIKHFTIQDGIIICNYDLFFNLLGIFRNKLVDIYGLKLSNQNRTNKLEILYDHVTNQKFIDRIQLLYNLYSDMKNSLDAEKNSIKRAWNKREMELTIFSDNVNSIWSELNAITNVFPEGFSR